MNTAANRNRIEEVRMMDMVDYLSKLGYEPVKIRNADYWYLSPLRNEHTPSFKINRRLNRWYDHGMGKGGNIIDFGMLYHNCSLSEFLQLVGTDFSFRQPADYDVAEKAKDRLISIIKEGQITSFPLLRYLAQRNIPKGIADAFCREVSYGLHGKNYYGIGFRNDSGGFELRNPYFKASSTPKDVTTFITGSTEVKVFEGFMDFLSFKTVSGTLEPETDVIVLNSLSFFEKSRPLMEGHNVIGLYLDRDAAGQNCSRKAMAASSRYRDESRLYDGFKDVNEWLAKAGGSNKKRRRLKL